MSFDLVVSLGSHCQPGLQIHRWTGQRPGFFDTLGTPFWGAKVLIEQDADKLAERFFCYDQSRNLTCLQYGLVFAHDVERDAEWRVIVSAKWLAAFEKRIRLRWRRQALLIGRARRVLFVRQNGYMRRPLMDGQYRFDSEIFTSGELWRLTEAIEARWPGLDYHLACCYFPKLGVWDFTTRIPNVSVHAFDYAALTSSLPPDLHWRGYEPDWNRMFMDLDVPRNMRSDSVSEAA